MPLWPRCTTRCKRLGGNGLMGRPAISQTVFRLGGEIDLPAMVGGMRRVLQQAGCSDAESMRMVTVASELSNNIIRYAGNGRLTVVVTQLERRVLIEITAEDRGPGIPNLDAALTERFSTGGGLGLGLPAVRRMVDDFQIDSAPGRGTKVKVRRWMA